MFFRHLRLVPRPIVAIPRARRAAADVTIDGVHYCSFVDAESAYYAAEQWLQNWPAVKGKRVRVHVRRGAHA